MSMFTLREHVALAGSIVAALVGAWAIPVVAQDKISPPNFSPNPSVGWIGVGGIRPVPGTVPPLAQDPKYPYVPNGTGQQPTYRIADLSNQNLKPWVKEIMKKDNDEVLAGKIAFTSGSSCTLAGVPAFLTLGGNNNPYRFVQSAKEVRILRDADSQVRRVYLNVPHLATPAPSWYGESVGRYEGDELVIDTNGLNDRTFVDNYRTPHTDQIHVVERFKLIEGGNILQGQVTVDDPGAFNMPWSAIQRWRRVDRPLTELMCAENNADFLHYEVVPLPQASKPDF